MGVNALSQLYGSDRWPRRAELDGRCERFVIPDALFDGAGFRLVWRDALPGARHSYRSFYHRDDDSKRELLAGFHNCTSLVPPSVVPQLGDVSYGNRAAQQFVRGNLLVSVANAGTVEVDVRPFAVALDEKVSDCLH